MSETERSAIDLGIVHRREAAQGVEQNSQSYPVWRRASGAVPKFGERDAVDRFRFERGVGDRPHRHYMRMTQLDEGTDGN